MAKRATPVYHSSKSDEWYTPPHIIRAARAVMGSIDLDPASIATANTTVQAARFYDADGLTRPWAGNVWLNPPYSHVKVWTRRLVDAYVNAEINQALYLVAARPGAQWFRPLYSYSICFVSGRLRFGNAPSSAPFDSAVAYLGPNVARFVEVFGRLGTIVQAANPPSQQLHLSLWKETAHGTETHQPGA